MDEIAKVEGFASVDFKTKEGDHIQGTSVFLSMPITNNGSGRKFEKVFFNSERWGKVKDTVAIGDLVTPVYNRYGKILHFAKVQDDTIDFGN